MVYKIQGGLINRKKLETSEEVAHIVIGDMAINCKLTRSQR